MQLEYVRKPVELIQCKNKFGLLQRKMYHVLLANAAENLYPGVKHQIRIGLLCEHMKYKSRDYESIKNRFRELRRLDMEWSRVNEHGNTVWTNTSPLSWARVISGVGICEYEFTPSLIPYLREPARWAKFSLATSSDFKSIYGLILFELCEQFKKINKTERFKIEKFREIMGLKQHEYKEFFAFKNRVIKKALAEVNKYWHHDVEARYEKRGRKVETIQFIMHPRLYSNKIISADDISDVDNLKRTLLANFGVSVVESNEWIEKYSVDYINEKIGYILASSPYKEGKIASMASYLRSYLKGDFQPPKSSKELLDKEKEIKAAKEILELKKERENKKLREEYGNFVNKHITRVIKKLGVAEHEELMKGFWDYMKDNPLIDRVLRKKQGKMFHANLRAYIVEYKPSLIGKIPLFEEYIKVYHPQYELNKENS